MGVDIHAFVNWSKSVFGVQTEDSPVLQAALERMGLAGTDSEGPRTLDLESLLVVVGQLLGKPLNHDDTLLLTKQVLLQTAREYFTAAQIIESRRDLNGY